MTTVPPLDSCRLRRLAGSAVTDAGGLMLSCGSAGGSGFAAMSANARKGSASSFINGFPGLAAKLTGYVGGNRGSDEFLDGAAIAGDLLNQP